VLSQVTEGLKVGVKEQQGLKQDLEELCQDIPTKESIEECLNRIYNRLLELEQLVQGKSESTVEVSRLTDSI
jgi:hypothetical protein